jgi:hypothetical protein
MRTVRTERASLETIPGVAQPQAPTRAEILAAGVCLAFLAFQLALPVAQLIWASRPARFGWQMYSAASAPPRFELIAADGSAQPVDIAPYVASLRGDVPVARFLPPHLCILFPHTVAVRYQAPVTAPPRTYPCVP